jgi:hypothetical protein
VTGITGKKGNFGGAQIRQILGTLLRKARGRAPLTAGGDPRSEQQRRVVTGRWARVCVLK